MNVNNVLRPNLKTVQENSPTFITDPFQILAVLQLNSLVVSLMTLPGICAQNWGGGPENRLLLLPLFHKSRGLLTQLYTH